MGEWRKASWRRTSRSTTTVTKMEVQRRRILGKLTKWKKEDSRGGRKATQWKEGGGVQKFEEPQREKKWDKEKDTRKGQH